MNKKLILAIVAVLISAAASAQNSVSVLKKMYARYHAKWRSSLTFDQTTYRYKPDGTLADSGLWHEQMLYPDKLRIDIIKSGVTILFRGDSTYAFRDGKVLRANKQENELIFYLGGMYAMPFDSVLAHFKKIGLDLAKFHTSTWKGKPVYVLGANTDGEKVKQIWIEQDRLIMLRNLSYDNNTDEEGIFEDHYKVGNAWSEGKCTFYFNGKIAQVEKYFNIKPNLPMDARIFDPAALTHK